MQIHLQLVDPELADAVLESFYRHMWYLDESTVIFSLADRDVTDDVKSRMVAGMIAAGRPQQFTPGKPQMKPELLRGRDPEAPQLHEFVGPRSWLLFENANLATEWMALPLDQWAVNPDFLKFKAVVANINVINDAAERAVKDVSDFANFCLNEGRRDEVIRVVNSHRELIDFKTLTKE